MTLSLLRLEDAITAGEAIPSKIGVIYEYRSEHGLPLALFVNVVGYGYRTLQNAPMTLSFLSSCCHHYLITEGEDEWSDEGAVLCGECLSGQAWVPSLNSLRVSSDRTQTTDAVSEALHRLYALNPLDAALAATDTVFELETIHEKYFTPAWARQKAVDVLGITHRLTIQRKAP